MNRFLLLTLLLISPHLFSAGVDPEKTALVALYNSTNGANWTNNTNWLQGEPCANNWFGVTCENGYVTKIDLATNNLIGSMVPEIGNLTQLKELWLYYNRISGEIPDEISQLSNMEMLMLGANLFSGEIPSSLSNLNNLNSLSLRDNLLIGTIPSSLMTMSSLQYLELYGNKLTGQIPFEIGDLLNLKRLDLSYNQLVGTIPASIGLLTNLRTLNLSANQFTGQIPNEFTQLSNLEYLVLGGLNQLDSEFPAPILNLTSLNQLVLSSSHYIGEVPAGIVNLTNLFELDLSYNGLYSNNPAVTNYLKNVTGNWNWDEKQTISPENFQVVANGSDTMALTWSPVVFQQNGGYEIAMSETLNGNYGSIAILDSKFVNMHLTDILQPNQDYYFKIRSYTLPHDRNNRKIISDWSEVISATTSATSSSTDIWVEVSSEIEKQAVTVDDLLSYTIRIGNNGTSDLSDVLFKHYFPIGLSLSSLSQQCQVIQGPATCPTRAAGHVDYLLDLPANSILEFTFDGYVQSNNTGMLYMSTTVSPSDGVNDINIENNSDNIHFDWIFTDTFEVLP